MIDNHRALVGGINLSKRFIAPDEGSPWLDYAVVMEGEEVEGVQKKIFRLYKKYFPENASQIKNLIGPSDARH